MVMANLMIGDGMAMVLVIKKLEYLQKEDTSIILTEHEAPTS